MKNRFLLLVAILGIGFFSSCEEDDTVASLEPNSISSLAKAKDGYVETLEWKVLTQEVLSKVELFKGEELLKSFEGEAIGDGSYTFDYTPVTAEVGNIVEFDVMITDVDGNVTRQKVYMKVNPGPPTLTFKDKVSRVEGIVNRIVTLKGSIYSPTPLTEVKIYKVVAGDDGDENVEMLGVTVDFDDKTFTYTYDVVADDFDSEAETPAKRASLKFEVGVKNEGLKDKVTISDFVVNVITEEPIIHLTEASETVVAQGKAVFKGNIELHSGLELAEVNFELEDGTSIGTATLTGDSFMFEYTVSEGQVGELSVNIEAIATEGEEGAKVSFSSMETVDFSITTALPSIAFTNNMTAGTVNVGSEFTLSGKVMSASEVTSLVIKMDGVALAEDDVTFDPATGMFSYTMEVGDEAKDVEFAVEAVNKTTGEAGKAMETFTLTISGNDI